MSVVQPHNGMSAATAHKTHQAGVRSTRQWKPGQSVSVFVQRPLGDSYYLATLDGGAAQKVASHVQLKSGSQLHAVVISVGSQLELQLLDAPEGSTLLAGDQGIGPTEAAPDSQLSLINARYGVPLTAADHDRLEAAMKTVTQPQNMALAGLYLARLALPLTPPALDALYKAQDGFPEEYATPPATIAAVVERMDQVLNDEPHGASDARSERELARFLLNVPVDASVARHYGTVPVLVSGQLVELQFVAFQHRETPVDKTPVRRLVMTLTPPALGPLQVAAQAQGNRLSITFTSESAHTTEVLATHAHEVRELVGRLGWQVDSVVYSTAPTSGAAQLAMTHALLGSTMDQLL